MKGSVLGTDNQNRAMSEYKNIRMSECQNVRKRPNLFGLEQGGERISLGDAIEEAREVRVPLERLLVVLRSGKRLTMEGTRD